MMSNARDVLAQIPLVLREGADNLDRVIAAGRDPVLVIASASMIVQQVLRIMGKAKSAG